MGKSGGQAGAALVAAARLDEPSQLGELEQAMALGAFDCALEAARGEGGREVEEGSGGGGQ